MEYKVRKLKVGGRNVYIVGMHKNGKFVPMKRGKYYSRKRTAMRKAGKM